MGEGMQRHGQWAGQDQRPQAWQGVKGARSEMQVGQGCSKV